jgi:hypothetical protein
VLESHLRGQRQTAYRILVASSAERLQRDEGDLWDSEKVESPEQNQIAYAGKRSGGGLSVGLVSGRRSRRERSGGQTLFPQGRADPGWSAGAFGHDACHRSNLMGVHVNGQAVGEAGDWQILHRFDLAPFLREGDNVLAILADTAGLLGKPEDREKFVTLASHGRHDVIHDIAIRTDMGSYGFIVNNGWTAMPEAWDANTGASMNHCMLGHIQQWFLGSLAGIRPEPLEPGFARFTIAPEPVGRITWARGEYQSIRGRISSSWKIEDGHFRLSVTIPPNTMTVVAVPAAKPGEVQESGKAAAESPGVRFLRHENGKAMFEDGSGSFEFVAQ